MLLMCVNSLMLLHKNAKGTFALEGDFWSSSMGKTFRVAFSC